MTLSEFMELDDSHQQAASAAAAARLTQITQRQHRWRCGER